MRRDSTCRLCGGLARLAFRLSHTDVYRCLASECGLHFAEPQLADSDLQRAYMELYYPGLRADGQPTFEPSPVPVLKQLVRGLIGQTGSLGGMRLLDFGCGTGELCAIAADLGARPTGIESADGARRMASARLGIPIYPDLDALQDCEPTARFDLVTLLEVVEHLREPWEVLTRLRQWMRPGGRLIISTPNVRGLRARFQGRRWPNLVNPTHLFYFTRDSLNGTLMRAGFRRLREWSTPIQYPKHESLRRLVQRLLVSLRLHGGLIFVAQNGESPRDTMLPYANSQGSADVDLAGS